jgi:hypothetical protein
MTPEAIDLMTILVGFALFIVTLHWASAGIDAYVALIRRIDERQDNKED